MDINTKKLKKNAFRVTKHRGITASRIRVPGGHLNAKYLGLIQEIAETYGNGTVHLKKGSHLWHRRDSRCRHRGLRRADGFAHIPAV